MIDLPKKYLMSVFPKSIDLIIPEFENTHPIHRTLVINDLNSYQLYEDFYNKLYSSIGKNYLPICRFGDGEYSIIVGKQKDDFRLPLKTKIRKKISRIISFVKYGNGINTYSVNHYHSGQYSISELNSRKEEIITSIKNISKKGILAFFLNYEPKPFYEKYFPALNEFLIQNRISINSSNYFPGYFVYALMTSSRKSKIICNRRVLIVNSAVGDKKERIIDSIFKEGAKDVFWTSISEKKSLLDYIDVSEYIDKVDIVFLGAGLGKFNIFSQLECLNVPVLDVGFVFEVWADPENKYKRMFCASDEDWNKIGSDPILAGI